MGLCVNKPKHKTMGQQLDNIQEQLKMQYDKSQANEHRLNQRINNLIQSAVPPVQVTVHNHPDRNFLRKLSHRNSYEKGFLRLSDLTTTSRIR